MEFIENFKLGTLTGVSALVVLGVVALVVVIALVVIIVNGAKAVKERKDKKEDDKEDAFFAEYGVTGEQVRLNESLAAKRERLRTRRNVPEVKWKVVEKVVEVEKQPDPQENQPEQPEKLDYIPMNIVYDEDMIYPIPPTVFDEDEVYSMEHIKVFNDNDPNVVFLPERMDEEDEIVQLEEYVEPEPEPEPEPVEEKVEEPVEEEPKPEEKHPDPLYPLPINEELIDEYYYTPSPELEDGREENWDRYNGNFAGFYYNPYDGCYHEGYAPKSLVKKLVDKQAEYNETHPDRSKKYIVM